MCRRSTICTGDGFTTLLYVLMTESTGGWPERKGHALKWRRCNTQRRCLSVRNITDYRPGRIWSLLRLISFICF